MLIGGIVAVVVIAGTIAAALLFRRTHDDDYSVEHYHRRLHTLEGMRDHPAGSSLPSARNGHAETEGAGVGTAETNGQTADAADAADAAAKGSGSAAYPASAFRVSGSSTVRLTEPGRTIPPPVPPPPVAKARDTLTFDDASASERPTTSFFRGDDKALHGIDHRPRRLGGPLAAVGVVALLVVVLIVTGFHSSGKPSKGKASTTTPSHAHTTTHTSTTHTSTPSHHHAVTTSTTVPAPVVSAPTSVTAHTATYQVASDSFSLVLSASSGLCWVDATDTATGSTLYTGTLFAGQSHTLAATGPVTVVAGAPAVFAATVNGVAVTLPPGYQAPFNLHFVTPTTTTSTTSASG